ncbi:unnamed protein product [Rotaria sordida]|uniref:SUN domain-containing protein n=1 Tax=Rotaria sordida TaxID=392033 RepID=A0A815KZF6_9BILA|nr:unnamed protein product [Rotaria sordida]CAF1399943.1 unnamed protein product [Rotaria sordida]
MLSTKTRSTLLEPVIWLVGIPFSAWLFTIHFNNSQIIDSKINEIKLKEFIRNELEKYSQQFQLTCKSNTQCITYHNFVSKIEYEKDIQQILDKCNTNFFSWFNSGQKIKLIIDEALRKYDSDNIALADYALESVGGSIITEYSSKTFTDRSPTFNIFGLPILKRIASPNIILRKGIMPGNCWPMIGSHGYVLISLAFPVRPTMFTLEHLPKTLSFDGQSRSAPKEFSIRGLNSIDNEGQFLGRFIYDTTKIDSSHIQTFHVQQTNDLIFYHLIKLIIESNWGHPEFTCIYRFRVHGQPQLPPSY